MKVTSRARPKKVVRRRGDTSHKSIDQPVTRFRLLTGPLRVLPDYIIIGAQKCGTTSLYRYLNEHPEIAAAAGKEVHYFDWHYSRGTSWYRAHFPTAFTRAMFHARTGKHLITGEASPYYLFHPHAPSRIKALLPSIKLIVLLRDPVERAFSSYHHQVRAGRESLSFAEAVDQEPARLASDLQRLSRDQSYKGAAHRRFSYVARGVYADQLDPWFRLFTRDQLLVIRSEDFFDDPATTVSEVLQFLGLSPARTTGYRRFNAGEYADMDPALKARLTKYFAPHNERLYELLGRDLGWPR
jgi:Sulfotransferase domain